MIKIWRLGDEGCACFKEFKMPNKVSSIKYDSVSKCLAVIDEKCHIGLYQYDFENSKEVSAHVSAAAESEIDLNEFEMADIQMEE